MLMRRITTNGYHFRIEERRDDVSEWKHSCNGSVFVTLVDARLALQKMQREDELRSKPWVEVPQEATSADEIQSYGTRKVKSLS